MDWKYSNDMSSFFLFEASGDSEGDLAHLHDSEWYIKDLFCMWHGVSVAPDKDDDAESCSYDCFDKIGFRDEMESFDVQVFSDTRVTDDEILPREKRVEEARGDVLGSGRENMVDEMERNRLFWETCLEVGPPMDYSYWS